MFWEFIHLTTDELIKRSHFSAPGGQVSLRKQVIFNSLFSRLILSLLAAWILGAGLIIFLIAFSLLNAAAVIANVGLVIIPVCLLYLLWGRPNAAHVVLLPTGFFFIFCSIIVFVVLLNNLAENGVVQPLLFWGFFFLIPSSVIYTVCALAARPHLILAMNAQEFPDDTPADEYFC